MQTLTAQDTFTGQSIRFDWDGAAPPTEADLAAIFAEAQRQQPPVVPQPVHQLATPAPTTGAGQLHDIGGGDQYFAMLRANSLPTDLSRPTISGAPATLAPVTPSLDTAAGSQQLEALRAQLANTPLPSRSLLGELATGAQAGLNDLEIMQARLGSRFTNADGQQAIAQAIARADDRNAMLGLSAEAADSYGRRSLYGGARALVANIPTTALMAVDPWVGMGTTAALYGVNQYDEVSADMVRQLTARGYSPQQAAEMAHWPALRSAFYEGGLEAVFGRLQVGLSGLSKIGSLEARLARLPLAGRTATRVAGTIGSEALIEEPIQNALSAAEIQYQGLQGQSPLAAALESIGPAAVATAPLALIGGAATHLQDADALAQRRAYLDRLALSGDLTKLNPTPDDTELALLRQLAVNPATAPAAPASIEDIIHQAAAEAPAPHPLTQALASPIFEQTFATELERQLANVPVPLPETPAAPGSFTLADNPAVTGALDNLFPAAAAPGGTGVTPPPLSEPTTETPTTGQQVPFFAVNPNNVSEGEESIVGRSQREGVSREEAARRQRQAREARARYLVGLPVGTVIEANAILWKKREDGRWCRVREMNDDTTKSHDFTEGAHLEGGTIVRYGDTTQPTTALSPDLLAKLQTAFENGGWTGRSISPADPRAALETVTGIPSPYRPSEAGYSRNQVSFTPDESRILSQLSDTDLIAAGVLRFLPDGSLTWAGRTAPAPASASEPAPTSLPLAASPFPLAASSLPPQPAPALSPEAAARLAALRARTQGEISSLTYAGRTYGRDADGTWYRRRIDLATGQTERLADVSERATTVTGDRLIDVLDRELLRRANAATGGRSAELDTALLAQPRPTATAATPDPEVLARILRPSSSGAVAASANKPGATPIPGLETLSQFIRRRGGLTLTTPEGAPADHATEISEAINGAPYSKRRGLLASAPNPDTTPDQLLQSAIANGFLPESASLDDLTNAIDAEIRGTRYTYASRRDTAALTAQAESRLDDRDWSAAPEISNLTSQIPATEDTVPFSRTQRFASPLDAALAPTVSSPHADTALQRYSPGSADASAARSHTHTLQRLINVRRTAAGYVPLPADSYRAVAVDPSHPVARAADAAARALGLQLVWFERANEQVDYINGARLPGTNVILLDVRAQDPILATVTHEATHVLRQANPDAWNNLITTIRANVQDGPLAGWLQWYAQRYGQGPLPLQPSELAEEYVANLLAEFGTDPKFWQDLAQALPAPHARSILQTLIDLLDQVLQRLGFTWSMRRKASATLTNLAAVRQAAAQALAQLSTADTTTLPPLAQTYDVRLSRTRQTADAVTFRQLVNEHFAGRSAADLPLRLGDTSPVLRALGLAQQPTIIDPSVLDRARAKHLIAPNALADLPAHLAHPIMVFASDTHPGRLVVLTDLRNAQQDLVAAIIQPDSRLYTIQVNEVISVNKRRPAQIQRWLNDHLDRYRDTQKSLTLAASVGLQLPVVNRPQSGFTHTVLTETDIVQPPDVSLSRTAPASASASEPAPEPAPSLTPAQTQEYLAFVGAEPEAAHAITSALRTVHQNASRVPYQGTFDFAPTAPAIDPAPAPAPALREADALRGDPQALRQVLDTQGRASALLHQFLSRQIPQWDVRGTVINSPADFFAALWPIRSPLFESMKIAVLSDDNVIVHSQIVTVGVLNASLFNPTNVVNAVLTARNLTGKHYNKVLLAHNHPSGDPTPSPEDVQVTTKAEKALAHLGITILDHVITNGRTFTSLREKGLVIPPAKPTRGARAPRNLPRRQPIAPPTKAVWETLPREDLQHISMPSQVASLAGFLRNDHQPANHIFYLGTRNHLLAIERIPATASIEATIFEGAAREGAAAVVLDLSGFGPDHTTDTLALSRRLARAAEQFGIQLYDVLHLGPTAGQYKSYRELGVMESATPASASVSEPAPSEASASEPEPTAVAEPPAVSLSRTAAPEPAPATWRQRKLARRGLATAITQGPTVITDQARATLESGLGYNPIGDALLEQQATDWVESQGSPEAAYQQIFNPDTAVPTDVRMAAALLIERQLQHLETQARQSGDTVAADTFGANQAQLLDWMLQESTILGRSISALRLALGLSKAMMESFTPAAWQVFAQREIAKVRTQRAGAATAAAVATAATELQHANTQALPTATRRAVRRHIEQTTLWQQYQRQIANSVTAAAARQLDPRTGQPKPQPPVAEFSARLADALRSQLAASLAASQPAPSAAGVPRPTARDRFVATLQEATTNPDRYREALTAAQNALRAEYANQPAQLAALDTFLQQTSPDSVNAQLLAQIVRQELDLAQLIDQHYTVAANAGQDLAASLVAQAGLTGPAAAQLQQNIASEIASLTRAAKQRALARLTRSAKASHARKLRSLADQIIAASNLGAFNEESLWTAVADRLKLPAWRPELAAELRQRAEAVQFKPAGAERQEAMAHTLAWIARQHGFKIGDLAWGAFYASILSGYKTHLVNTLDTALNVLAEFQAQAIVEPAAAAEMLRGLAQGAARGWTDAKGVLATGVVTGTRLHKHDAMSPLELKAMEAGPFHWTRAARYVGRAMAAEDMLNFRAAESMRAHQLAFRQARAEGIRGRQALRQRVDEILAQTQPQIEAARTQAAAEGLTGWRATRRTREILEQSRDADLVQGAAEFGRRATHNQDPEGAAGAVAAAIASATHDVPAIRAVIPFTKIVANVLNRTLDYSPYGFKRAFYGHSGGTHATEAPTGLDRAAALVKAAEGTLVMAGLLALFLAAKDDDDPWLDITADGPANATKRAQLQRQGWAPFSIKLGGHWISYRYTPFHLVGAIIGAWADANRYGRSLEDRSLHEKISIAIGIGVNTVLGQSYMAGLADFFTDITRPGANALQNFNTTLASVITPRLVQDIDNLFAPTARVANDPLEALTASIPVVRQYANDPRLDVLGQPIERSRNPLSRFYSARTDDPLWDVLARRGLFIPGWSANSTLPIPNDPRTRHRADRQQLYDLNAITGPEIRARLQSNLDWLARADHAAAQRYINRITEVEHRKAKAQYGLTAQD
jgi:DNA repair protein RadC